MCLLLFALHVRDDYPLIVAANRDEFYERPSAPVDFWEDAPDILAGRDLKEGGTWLGITRAGRIAALTNYRDPGSFRDTAPSRGALVSRYLQGNQSPEKYLGDLASHSDFYNGFNLIVGDSSGLFYFSNRTLPDRDDPVYPLPEISSAERSVSAPSSPRKISPGIHGLSNSLLDIPWPKVIRGKKALETLLAAPAYPEPELLLAMLEDRTPAADDLLPSTGVGIEWERMLSPMFIHRSDPGYGTRSSTVILVDGKGTTTFVERIFDRRGVAERTSRFVLRRDFARQQV